MEHGVTEILRRITRILEQEGLISKEELMKVMELLQKK